MTHFELTTDGWTVSADSLLAWWRAVMRDPSSGPLPCVGCGAPSEVAARLDDAGAGWFRATFTCGACGHETEVEPGGLPLPPHVENLPAAYLGLTRAAWEARFGPWEGHCRFQRLAGWPGGRPGAPYWLLVVHGQADRRKTWLALAAAGEALERGASVRFEDARAWTEGMRAHRFARHDEAWAEAASADVLVLDHVALSGPGALGRWAIGRVAELLRYRHLDWSPTIVTMRDSPRALVAFDPGLRSRLLRRSIVWRMRAQPPSPKELQP